MENITLSFEKKVLDYMVEKAMEFKLGARGLRSICENIMLDAMYDMPSAKDIKEFKITLGYAKKQFEKSSLNQLKVA